MENYPTVIVKHQSINRMTPFADYREDKRTYTVGKINNQLPVIVKHETLHKTVVNLPCAVGEVNNKLAVIVKHNTLCNDSTKVDNRQTISFHDNTCTFEQTDNKPSVIVRDCGKKYDNPQTSEGVDNGKTSGGNHFNSVIIKTDKIPTPPATVKTETNSVSANEVNRQQKNVILYIDARGIESSKVMYTCMTCNKRFNCMSSLTKHERVHTGEAPHECPVCYKGFTRAAHLVTHHRLFHDGQRPYKCPLCDKHFSSAPGRHAHFTRIHSTHNPYSCHVCYERFTEPAGLIEHLMKKHGLKKVHQCDVCGKVFTTVCSLNKHSACHVAMKHACTVCKSSFATTRLLGSHMKAQHSYTDSPPVIV